MTPSTETKDTRDRLLDAGEVLFAEQGFAGASARAITAAAQTNLNAISYHFGSKEGLFRAVVHRIMGPVGEAQLRDLSTLETEDGATGQAPSLEELLGAYIAPFMDMLERDPVRGLRISRLMARVLADAGGRSYQAALDELDETEERYLRAYARVLPHLSPEELWWRFQATAVVIVSHRVIVVAGRHSQDASGAFRQWMRPYLSAAMRAPSESAVPPAQRAGPGSKQLRSKET